MKIVGVPFILKDVYKLSKLRKLIVNTTVYIGGY